MTIQDLKDNRSEIIARINESYDAEFTSKIMKGMMNLIEGGMNDSNNPIDLVDEVAEMFNCKKQTVNTLWGHGCKYSTQAEYQRSCLNIKL